ncbi:chaperone for protein-folding within the ER, fungal-domain-containing protein [Crassisporium funariophilum]|nr:chaperone for protein-folding within the ER, fungal-domain-containing protein [Crassisporium funariophilum]
MILTSLLTVVLASLARIAAAQDDTQGDIIYNSVHNATVITGTWSTGSKAVLTGPGFANPGNMSFNYPKTTGVSYSFSDDGFYEISRYRFNSNGAEPTCITGVIGWVHGTFSLNSNGSITMVPMGDGYQQIQDPCAPISNFIEVYNFTEYYKGWRIFTDPTAGFKLHLFQFDGSPVAPMFQISTTPEMLPTRLLRNVTGAPTVARRSLSGAEALGPHWAKGLWAAAGMVVMATSSLML